MSRPPRPNVLENKFEQFMVDLFTVYIVMSFLFFLVLTSAVIFLSEMSTRNYLYLLLDWKLIFAGGMFLLLAFIAFGANRKRR